MKSLCRARGPWLATIGMVAAIALATATPPLQAQPPRFLPEDMQPPPLVLRPEGTDLFRALLDKAEIEPVRENDLVRNHPTPNIIIVVIGAIPERDSRPMQLARAVLEAGGAAFIASDSGFQLYEHGRLFNLTPPVGSFAGTTVFASWDECYRDERDYPYVVPISPDELRNPPERPGRVWNVFRGLNAVATNQPTYIHMSQFSGEYQYPLARLPKSSVSLGIGRFDTPPLFAVGGDGPERDDSPGYSFLAMADSSVFINQMLMAPNTDNLELTLRTIEYLQGPEKLRKKCIFYENGRVVDSFDGLRKAMAQPRPKLPLDSMPNIGTLFGKNQDKLIKFLDEKADLLQEKDVIQKALIGPEGSEREYKTVAKLIEFAVVGASVVGVFLLLRRLWQSRLAQDVPPPPTTGAGTASTGPPGVFDRRQKEMVRRNNLYEPVRNMVREFFDSIGAPPNPGPKTPKLEISDAVRKPDSLRHAVHDMWRLAYGPPTAITAQRWFELEPYFDRLKQAHADGKWNFVT